MWRKVKEKSSDKELSELFIHGDPYGNRTHVTAVKGRCLNHLTNGPGSGNLIRTDDIPGMNRLLYQLSYAAVCGQRDFGTAEISFLIIHTTGGFVKQKYQFFWEYYSRGEEYETMEKCATGVSGRHDLCHHRAAVAGQNSRVYVCPWGHLFSAHR